MLSRLFSKEEVNTGRQPSLDYAKGLAIICMILCHTTMVYSFGNEDLAAVVADDFLGGPIAAPMFMMCLGIGTCYSRHSSPLQLIRRGAILFLCAYLLNFMRAILPLYIASLMGYSKEVMPFMSVSLLGFDILQFAGLAFIFLGITKKLQFSEWQLACTAFICAITGSMCAGFTTGNESIDSLIGVIIPTGHSDGEETYFPFLNWIIFSIVGTFIGKLLRHCKDSDKFYGITFFVTLAMSAFYTWESLTKGFMPFSHGHYCWPTLADSIFFIAYDLCIISTLHYVSKCMPELIFKPLVALSRNINTVYCTSWVVITWTGLTVIVLNGMKGILSLASYGIGIVIVFVSYRLALVWKRYKDNYCQRGSSSLSV